MYLNNYFVIYSATKLSVKCQKKSKLLTQPSSHVTKLLKLVDIKNLLFHNFGKHNCSQKYEIALREFITLTIPIASIYVIVTLKKLVCYTLYTDLAECCKCTQKKIMCLKSLL